MKEALRVVHPTLVNQPLVVRDREVWIGPDGCTSPLTEEEHAYLTSIPGLVCASLYDFAANPRPQPEQIVLSDAELGRIHAAGFRLVPIEDPLEGEDLVKAVVETFDGEVLTLPSLADLAEKVYGEEEEESFEDLFDAWLGMDEAERCAAVGDLEENGADETLLIALFDFEANHHNNPKALAAIDTAIGHRRPATSVGQINQGLVKQSAAGKVKTKNPPHKQRGK